MKKMNWVKVLINSKIISVLTNIRYPTYFLKVDFESE